MDLKREQRAKEIFADALEKADATERAAYLTEVCGHDAELRREVESLLRAHERARDFLGGDSCRSLEEEPGEGPGSVIGRYKLLQLIGEGGFGRVYMAEQVEPVRRKVALKIIKLGMDTREVVARFEAERQALALMDHPNIAQVHDGGATPSGRPYFVMELVKGIPLTDYCDRENLSTEERLRLFVNVCHAVQHAHQKGVIHRDLKPSNILVTVIDGKPVPKVIDFGIAKAIGHELTQKTLFTRFEQMIGTPAYLSPEQAALSGVDVDTRSDIYSLGVMLYELLTGVTPLDQATLRQAALDEIRRIIRETEPPKPSTRLHRLGEKLTEVAHRRQTAPSVLPKLLRGDLDWIVMKALEKDRRRRYETATALALDIQHHLAHEPVVASPPSRLYRARKFIRRHRLGVGMTAAVGAALLVGLIASLIGFTRASRERDRAALAERLAQKEAAKATTTVNLVAKMFGAQEAGVPTRGRDFTVRQMLDEFCVGLGDQLENQPEVEGEVERIVATAYSGLGLSEPHQIHAEKALAARRRAYGDHHVKVAEAIFPLVFCYRGQRGVQLASEAIAIYRALEPHCEGFVDALCARAWSLNLVGRKDEAHRDAQEAWAVAQQLSPPRPSALWFALVQLGNTAADLDEAEAWLRQALDWADKLYGSRYRRPALTRKYLGEVLSGRGDYAAAEPYLRQAFSFDCWAYGTNSPHSLYYSALLRANLRHQGKSDPALDILAWRDTLEQVKAPDRASVLYKLRLHTPGEYRLYLRWDSHDAESDSLYAQIPELNDGPGGAVADVYGFVIPLFPGDADFATLPAWQGEADFEELNEGLADVPALWHIATPGDYTVRLVMSEDGAALDALVLQLASLPAPEGNGPLESEIAGDGAVLEREGRVVVEAEHFTRRVDGKTTRWLRVPQENEVHVSHLHYRGSGYLQLLPDDSPDDPAELSRNRGVARAYAGDHAEAVGHFARAVEAAPDNQRWRYELAMAQWGAGDVQGHGATLQRMLEGLEEAGTNASPGLIPWTCALCPDALEDYAPALALADRAVAADAPPGTRIRALTTHGALLYRAKRYPEAIARLSEALAIGQRATRQPTDPSPACTAFFLAMAHHQAGHTDEARSCFQQALDWERKEIPSAATGRPMPWTRQLTLDLLHRETQARLGRIAAP